MMLTGYNWTRSEIMKLHDSPTLWKKVTDKLKTIPVDQKVLRWPDGNESIVQNIPFDAESDQVFIDLCEAGEVEKVIFRANPEYVEESVDTYERLISAGLEVTYVEAGNEPYFAPQVNVTSQEFWRLFWDFRQWNVNMDTRIFRLKARQHALKTKILKGKFASRGYNLTSKFAYPIPTPIYFKDKEWLRISLQELPKEQFPIVVLHLYNMDAHGVGEWESWEQDQIEAIELLRAIGLRWISSEANAIHFGQHGKTINVPLANTEYHVQKNKRLLIVCRDHGCELFQYHKLAGFDRSRQFHKWDLHIPTLTLDDRQPDFTLNPNE